MFGLLNAEKWIYSGLECRKVSFASKKSLFHPIKNESKPIVSRSHAFSRALRQLHVVLRVLIGSLYYLHPLRLTRVITLVWVLRPLIENHCTKIWVYAVFPLKSHNLSHFPLAYSILNLVRCFFLKDKEQETMMNAPRMFITFDSK